MTVFKRSSSSVESSVSSSNISNYSISNSTSADVPGDGVKKSNITDQPVNTKLNMFAQSPTDKPSTMMRGNNKIPRMKSIKEMNKGIKSTLASRKRAASSTINAKDSRQEIRQNKNIKGSHGFMRTLNTTHGFVGTLSTTLAPTQPRRIGVIGSVFNNIPSYGTTNSTSYVTPLESPFSPTSVMKSIITKLTKLNSNLVFHSCGSNTEGRKCTTMPQHKSLSQIKNANNTSQQREAPA